MIAEKSKVKLVRLTSVASDDLKALIGEVGEVKRVTEVNGKTKLEVWFRVGWGHDRDRFYLYPDEVEEVPDAD